MAGFAWVTLATNDSYSLGALVLANSLRQVGTSHQLAVLVTPGVTNAMREQLRSIFNVVVEVNILDSKDEANLRLLQRPELGVTFTKLHCWRLTQFEKCVFLDADTLVLQNADELFEREELSAAPDVGWPDCFNSGVFVYRPSNETYENLVKFALERGSFDGGDQGLLNLYFSDWAHKDISKHLPFLYNTCSTASYSYLPAFKQFGAGIKIIHFIGPAKPWLQYFDTESRQVQPTSDLQYLQPVLQHWWDLFFSFIQPKLSSEMARSKSSAVHNPQPYPQPFYTSFTPSASVTYEIHENTYVDHRIIENESGPESDYKNVWDPWEEYEQNTNLTSAELVEHSTQLIADESITNIDSGLHESHNTNAHSVLPTTLPQLLPEPVQPSITTFSPPDKSQTSKSYTENVEIKSTSPCPSPPPFLLPPPPPPPAPPKHPSPPPIEIPHVSIETQYSYTTNNNSSNVFPSRIPTPPPTHQTYAQPHEFETPCTVANESILHPNDNGSHNNDGDAGLAGAFSQLKLGEPRSPGQLALEDHLRRQGWEVGNIDYLGKDSFENIWKKICQTIDAAPKPKEPTPPPPVAEAPAVPSPVAPETVQKDSPESQTQEQVSAAPAPASAEAAAVAVAAASAEEPPAAAVAATESQPAVVEAQTPTAPAPVPDQVQAPSAAAPAEVPAEALPTAAPAEVLAEVSATDPSASAPPIPVPVPEQAPTPVSADSSTETPSTPLAPVSAAQEPVPVASTVTPAKEETSPVAAPTEASPTAEAAVVAPAQSLPEVAPKQAEAPSAAVPEQGQAPVAALAETQTPPVIVPSQPQELQAPAAVLEQSQAASAAAPEQPQVPSAAAPEQPQVPSGAAPEQPQAPSAAASEQPQAPSVAAPEQPEAPSAAAPEQPQAPSVAAPEQPQAPSAAAPEQPQAPSAVAPEQPQAPSAAVSEQSQAQSQPQVQPAAAPEATAKAPAKPVAETAKAAVASKTKEGVKKSESKPAAAASSEPTSPTPPPRKAGSSPKKTKAKK